MIWIILCGALAMAAEPDAIDDSGFIAPLPAAPVRAPDRDGDCTFAIALLAGSDIDCDAVALPPTQVAHLLDTELYAEQLLVRVVALEAVRAAIEEPLPWWRRPGPQKVGAFALGAGTVALGVKVAGGLQ